jgi:hypothetical protein
MTDRPERQEDGAVEARARAAGHAVDRRTAALDPEGGLEDVVRRGGRPRATTGLAVLVVVLLAVPTVAFVRGLTGTDVQLETPAASPTDEVTATEPVTETTETPAPTPGPAATPTPTTEPTTEEPAGPEPAGDFGTAEVTAGNFPFGGGEVAFLTDVRVGAHAGFERVVLELDGRDLPSYRVTSIDPPITQDGSGDELEVEGVAFLEIRLTPASGVDSVGTGWEPTYTGPARVRGATTAITEVVRTGDFEANLAWVVGLRSEQAFAVTTLSDPLRLVVDIETP